ncbi:hypothetical protein B0T20DRAFT_389767 [Sordaria brevicollis]|uniref:Uncharacterized protein n=1 Tax=Sordaria brevicollis TaxID=83679 RepID=A0AAE0PL26_SORBR|nr:hypothetical protein B0T20DRAFT_389767 [Sordaria brevicollis]
MNSQTQKLAERTFVPIRLSRMPRTLATARGPRVKKIEGVNHKLLASTMIRPLRMSAQSQTQRARRPEAIEKIFEFAAKGDKATDKNMETRRTSQRLKDKKAKNANQGDAGKEKIGDKKISKANKVVKKKVVVKKTATKKVAKE